MGELVEEGFGVRGGDALAAEGEGSLCFFESAHATAFDADVEAGVLAHKFQVAGDGGGYVVRIDALGHAAQDDHHLFVEKRIVNDDLQQSSSFDAGVGHLDEFHFLVLKLAREHFAGVGIGVEDPDAAPDEVAAFEDLDSGVGGAEGMADGAGHLDNAQGEESRCGIDVARADEHRAYSMLAGAETPVVERVFGQRFFEDFVVDFFGEVFFAFEDCFGFAFFTTGFGGGGV